MSDVEPTDEELDGGVVDAAAAEGAGDGETGAEAPETAVAVLEYLAKALVADPDGVRVEADDSDGSLTLNVYVADGDMGRVIGKRGRVANAIRSIGRAAAAKDGETGVAIEFVD
jgi:predicted RNA-binding protein YlqC (UPF0109 family)